MLSSERTVAALNLAALTWTVLSTPCEAHVGDLIDTLDVQSTTDGVFVEGTFGLLAESDDGFAWVCHEAVTAEGAITSPDYTRSPSGTWISRMPDLTQARDGHPLWVSDDLCSWTFVPGFDTRVVADVAFGADDSVWVVTADPSGPNSVFHGPDVNSLAEVHTVPDSRLLSIEVGAAIWVTSTEGDAAITLWHSPDGTAFTAHPIAVDAGLATPVDAFVEVAHPTDPDAAWVVLDPIGEDRLLQVSAAGATQTEIWQAPDRITDVARTDDGTLYAILGDRRPWRVSGTPTDLVELADAAGVDAVGNGIVLSGRTFTNEVFLTRSDDGTSAVEVLGPEVITEPFTCPNGTDQATICAPLWPQLEVRLQPADTADTGSPPDTDVPDTDDTGVEDDRPCGCRTSATWGWSLGWLARRR